MTNQDRIELQWRLLSNAHPKFCVSLRGRSSTTTLLIGPKDTNELSLQEFQKAKSFYDNLILLPDQDLSKAAQSLSIIEQAQFEAKHYFNQAEALADDDVFGFWSRAELWTLGEATALINGRNPSIVTQGRIERDESETKISIKLKQTMELLYRAKQAGTLYLTNRPKAYIEWVELKHIEIPQQLKDLSLQRSGTNFTVSAENKRLKEMLAALEAMPVSNESDDKTAKSEKPIGIRERESLLKLILGMAIHGYGYDPKATKSTQISAIASDLQILGLALDEDTVRKYLNEAKGLFADVITE